MQFLPIRLGGWIAALLIFSSPLIAMGPTDELPLDPAIKHGRLPNGLVYYIKHNSKPEKRVELRLVVNAGSVEEDDDQQGLAHLIEHLCFRGTRHFPKEDLLHYLQSVGTDIGPDANAYTGTDETVFKLNVPAESDEVVNKGVMMLRDWAGEVTFDPADVDKERSVVIEEWRLRQGAEQRMTDQVLPVVFQGLKHAQRQPIGKKDIVEHAPLDVIKRFYHDWYRPDNMAVIVVGDIDPEKAQSLVTSVFQDIPASSTPLRTKPDLEAPLGSEKIFSALSDAESTNNVVRLSFPSRSIGLRSQTDLRRQIDQTLAIQMMNTRLAAVLEKPAPPFLYANASYGRSSVRFRSDYTVLALVGDGGAGAGLEALAVENERVRRLGFSVEEFDREKSTLVKSVEERYAERDHQESESLAQSYLANFLFGDAAPSGEVSYHATKAALADVSVEEVNQIYRDWAGSGGEIVRVETNQKAGNKLLSRDDLSKIIDVSKTASMEAYHEKVLPTTLMTVLPEPGKIASRNFIGSIGVTEWMLSNGARVILKPSAFKKDEVVLSFFRAGGQSSFPDEYDLASKVAGGYVSEAGLGNFAKSDLQKILSGKDVQLGARIDPSWDILKGRCSTTDLETAFQLIHLYFNEPRRDENIYKTILAANTNFETSVVMNPVLSFVSDIQEIRYNHHPRTQRLIQPEKAWKALTLDQVLQVYRSRFDTANGGTFVLVGSFDLNTIEPLVARYLASIPEKSGVEKGHDLGLRAIKGPFAQTLTHGADPKSVVYLTYEADAEWNLHDAHMVWSLGNILQRVLFDKVRVEMSGAYTMNVRSGLEKFPFGHYDLEIGVPCAPENVDKIVKSVSDAVKQIILEGPSAADLQKEVEAQRLAVQRQLQSNPDWLWELELIYQYNEGFGRVAKPYEMMSWVTAENLKAAAKKYWRTDQWVTFILTPQKATP